MSSFWVINQFSCIFLQLTYFLIVFYNEPNNKKIKEFKLRILAVKFKMFTPKQTQPVIYIYLNVNEISLTLKPSEINYIKKRNCMIRNPDVSFAKPPWDTSLI